MKRALLFGLLLLLPYQFAWAAVSLYCSHQETEQAATHFGHHDHDHAAELGEAKTSSPDRAPDLNGDHEHYGNTLALDAALIVAPAQPSCAFLLISTTTPHDFAPAEPERPNWTPAA